MKKELQNNQKVKIKLKLKSKPKTPRSKEYGGTEEDLLVTLAKGGFKPIRYKYHANENYTEYFINEDCTILHLLDKKHSAHKNKDYDYMWTIFKYNKDRSKNNAGYHLVDIGFTALLHRVMADTFLPEPDDPNKNCIDHIDGNKDNNHPSNL